MRSIQYLLNEAESNDFKLIVGDKDLTLVNEKISGHKRAKAISFDVFDKQQRVEEILKADIVISMLPANLHFKVAQDCVKYGKNLVTASYVSDEIKSLDSEAKQKGVLLLNEIGLDPGIDHMSAKKMIDQVELNGGKIIGFESFTGGLVAPESDDNPWNYKFTWNPRNVVLAGQGGAAKFIKDGKYKYIPYNKLFRRTQIIDIEGFGKFEGYPNRDSLKYREVYGIEDIPTIYRGTLRKVGFCRAWNMLVILGMTDDTFLASLVPIFLGFGFVIAKPAMEHFPPFLLMGLRFTFAASILIWWFPIPRGFLKKIFIVSFIANTLQYGITYTGLNMIDASAAVLLVQMEVIFGVIFAYFMLKEKPTARSLIGIGIAFIGIYILTGSPNLEGKFIGAALTVTGAGIWALGQVLVKPLSKEINPLALVAWLALFSGPILIILSAIIDGNTINYLKNAKFDHWIIAIYIGFIMQPITYGCFYYVLKNLCR